MMAIQHTYRDIEITLLEDENKWRFTANGRERTAPTLPKAREYIDNALDAVATKKEKPWEPFEAWATNGYSKSDFRKVRVTSEAERSGSERKFWIVGPYKDYRGKVEDKREKVSMRQLFAASPENQTLITQTEELQARAEALHEEAAACVANLQPIQVPASD